MKASGLCPAIAVCLFALASAACVSGGAGPPPAREPSDFERYGGPPQRDWENFDRAEADSYASFRA